MRMVNSRTRITEILFRPGSGSDLGLGERAPASMMRVHSPFTTTPEKGRMNKTLAWPAELIEGLGEYDYERDGYRFDHEIMAWAKLLRLSFRIFKTTDGIRRVTIYREGVAIDGIAYPLRDKENLIRTLKELGREIAAKLRGE